MQQITILGATGSIGASTLDVIGRHPDRYSVYALTANSRVEALVPLCARFQPKVVVVGTAQGAATLEKALKDKKLATEVMYGAQALSEVASARQCDVVMAAIVGAAGLAPTLAAARAGKKLLLANKEALVMSGQLFMDAVADSGAVLLPIDSEHNAIFQCLPQQYQRTPERHGIAKLMLTASGGPFLNRDLATFDTITPEEAVAHPNWVMGRKISVDSATMMNKGLEVIEAHWLFGMAPKQIDVVIHPQSVIHSMVAYVDGSMLAQLGNPDMRTPIAHALAYPERIASGVEAVDLTKISQLAFRQPDYQRFPCLKLAYDALEAGGSVPTVLNAANEVAVEAFLNKKIRFDRIPRLIAQVMEKLPGKTLNSVEELISEDQHARELAYSLIQS